MQMLSKRNGQKKKIEVKRQAGVFSMWGQFSMFNKSDLEHHHSWKHVELEELQGQKLLDKVNTLEQSSQECDIYSFCGERATC